MIIARPASILGVPLPGPSRFPTAYVQTGENSLLLPKSVALEETLDGEKGERIGEHKPLPEGSVNSIYLDVYREENICLIASYFTVGFSLFFSPSPIYYYLVDTLNTSSTEVGVFITIVMIPWSLKVLFGLLSDTVPLFGYRRKPYILIGWAVYVFSNLVLAMIGTPTALQVIFWGFIMMNGLLFADVCTDTMTVERAKLESDSTRGLLQTTGYIYRGLGMVFGSVLGATLYNKNTWGWGLNISQIFFLSCIVPLIAVGYTFQSLVELSSYETPDSVIVQLKNIWKTLQLRAVWRPMAFIYTYNVLQVPNSAWNNYLIVSLNFTDFDIGLLRVATALMLFVGLVAYKSYFFNMGWREIYIYTTIVGVIFSFMQLLLIYQVNQLIGIPNIIFSIGDTVFSEFSTAVQMMPTSIMYVTLCPDGSEGATYALLTTMSNLAGTVASDFGSWLTQLFNVTNSELMEHNYTGLVHLSILTSFLQFLPIFLVFLLPNTKEEQRKMQEEGNKSVLGGFSLAFAVLVSILFTIILNGYLLHRTNSNVK